MVAITRFVLLNLYLLSHVAASISGPTADGSRWLVAGRSVVVPLWTPDLPFWRDGIVTPIHANFIFNFTLTPDNLVLLLNGEPILPRPHPYVPSSIRVYQVKESMRDVAYVPLMDLDYYISTPDTTSATSIYNTQYNPRIQIDILRVRGPTGTVTPLSSNLQKQMWVYLSDLSHHAPGTPYSTIPLRIQDVKVDYRWVDTENPGKTTTYKTPEELKTCHIWSWLCADIKEYPYYKYIYQENFDQYGKKGSMRHFLTMRWGNMVALLGFGRAMVLLAVCVSMVLSPFVYAMYRGVKRVLDLYRTRVQEVDDWIADEEVEGLLVVDTYQPGFGEGEKMVEEEKGGEKIGLEKPLPALPTDIPMKEEKTSIS